MDFDANSLLPLNKGENERVGFILNDGSIVELENICSDPLNGFEVKGDDLLRYEDRVSATWHTHPGASSNPSIGDYQGFLNYPDWKHHIVGDDGVVTYEVRNGRVLIASADLSSRET
jgi:proteasome lid subunit RPN8/RPN11